jgi:hypothetical protein
LNDAADVLEGIQADIVEMRTRMGAGIIVSLAEELF